MNEASVSTECQNLHRRRSGMVCPYLLLVCIKRFVRIGLFAILTLIARFVPKHIVYIILTLKKHEPRIGRRC